MEFVILIFVSTIIAVVIGTVRPAHWRIHKLLHASFRAYYHGSITSGMDELVSCIASLAYATRYNKTQKARVSLFAIGELLRELPRDSRHAPRG